MVNRKLVFSLVVGVSMFLTAALGMLVYQPAQAQCGDNPPDSSCITCHAKEAPVANRGAWHEVHAQKDCCAKCHGGNCSAVDKEAAHAGMTIQPLEDVYVSCSSCHPDDYLQRAAQFGVILGVKPGSSPTATPVSAGRSASQQMVIPQPPAGRASFSLQGFQALGLLAVIGLFLLALGQLARHPVVREADPRQVR